MRAHASLVGPHDRQHIGQVELTLRVVGGDLAESGDERPTVERVDARADLADPHLELRGVARRLRLDHALDRAVGRPHHPAVAARVIEHRRRQRRRRARAGVRLGQPGQRLRVDQRMIRVQHDHRVRRLDLRHRRLHGISRAQRLRLHRHRHLAVEHGRQRPVGPLDHDHLPRAGSAGSRHRPGDHRPATHLVEQLRRSGAHPRALPGSKNDNDRRGHTVIVGDCGPIVGCRRVRRSFDSASLRLASFLASASCALHTSISR